MEKGKIFISYRREDTSGESGRLKDNLEQIFGKENIFYDVETLEAGLNFDQSIAKALSESKVLLAMIGPHWMKVTDSKGIKRLQKPEDWVRKEIAEALKRNLRVIPVLVNGADMPDPEELPEDLIELTLKHAQELTSSRWNYDVGILSKVLEKLITKNPESNPQSNSELRNTPRPLVNLNPEPKKWWAKNYLYVIGGFVGFLILIGMCTRNEPEYVPDNDSEIGTDIIAESEETVEDSEQPSVFDQPAATEFDYSGKWWLWENDVRSGYLLINQNGYDFTFEYYYFDAKVAEGKGVYDGTHLYSTSFLFYDSPGEYSFSFGSDDQGITWYGQTSANELVSESELTRN